MAAPKLELKLSTTSPKTQEEVEVSIHLPEYASSDDISGHVQSPGNIIEDLKFDEAEGEVHKAKFTPRLVGRYHLTVSCCYKPCSPITMLVSPRGEVKTTIVGRPKLNNPSHITEFGSNFLICNKGNHEVIVSDRSGILKNKFVNPVLSSSQSFEPYAIAVRNDKIVVSDLENRRVIQYNQDWVPVKQIGEEHLYRPTGVVIDQDDKIYVADDHLSSVRVFDQDGRLIKTIGWEGTKPGELKKPWHIDLNSNRQLVVADCQNCRIQIFNSITGELIHCFKVKLDGNDMAVRGLAVDKHDIIYITAVTNTRRLLKKVECVMAYTMDGEYIGRFGGPLSLPRGISIMEENGELLAYVVDGGNHRIRVFHL